MGLEFVTYILHFAGQGNAGPGNSEHSLRSCHETGKDLNCLPPFSLDPQNKCKIEDGCNCAW